MGGGSDWFGQLEREWLTLQPHWYCQHAPGVGEAGTALEAASFDALIVDGGTCDVDILLSTMEEKLGKMICLVRCDVSDRTTLAQWNRTGMTPVAFETDASALAMNLKRIARLRS